MSRVTIVAWDDALLLIAQGFDRVEAGGAEGRIRSEQECDDGREADGDRTRLQPRDVRDHARDGDERGHSHANQNAAPRRLLSQLSPPGNAAKEWLL